MRNDQRAYFAAWLDRTLTERDLSGGEVARALKVNDSAISRWRNGKGAPGLDSVMKLAAFLGCDPIRLAVTAGLMRGADVGLERLPLPEDTRRREGVKGQIMGIRGLTVAEKEALMKAYDEASNDGVAEG